MLSDAASVSAVSATGTTELRAMYGGLQGAIGVLAITAFFTPTLVNPFLVALITISVGLLLGWIDHGWWIYRVHGNGAWIRNRTSDRCTLPVSYLLI